jgi:hypothetical protein
LNRDFATVEITHDVILFARAVETRWPCPQATATRERLEAQQRYDEDQERRRREYLSQRESEGVTGMTAELEFWAKEKEASRRP